MIFDLIEISLANQLQPKEANYEHRKSLRAQLTNLTRQQKLKSY